MNCPNCQSVVTPGASYCTVCGSPLSAEISQSASPVTAPSNFPSYPAGANASPGASNTYASWGRRVGATLLDAIVPFVSMMIIAFVTLGSSLSNSHFAQNSTGTSSTCHVLKGTFVTLVCSDGSVVRLNLGLLLAGIGAVALAWGIYVVAAVAGRHQGTWGMRVLKIKIATASGHQRVSVGRSLGRYAAVLALSFVSKLIPLLGLAVLLDELWPLWDQKNQTLHDKVAGTVALDARP